MAKQIDVYREWLGIAESARPLNHYQLLKLRLFEDDTEKIRAQYRQFNAHVRKYAAGEFGPESQKLLNELAKAMLCLTDGERKAEYDAFLGRTDTRPGRRRTLEQILLAQRALNQDQLAKARSFAKAVGLEVREAILQQKLAAPDLVVQAYAESVGLSYLDLDDVQVDRALIVKFPAVLAREQSCVPVMIDEDRLLVASPNPVNPDVEDQLRLRFGIPARSVLCTPASIHAALAKYYPRDTGQTVRRKKQAEDDESEDEVSPQERLKQRLVIGGLVLSGSFCVYMAYRILKALFGR